MRKLIIGSGQFLNKCIINASKIANASSHVSKIANTSIFWSTTNCDTESVLFLTDFGFKEEKHRDDPFNLASTVKKHIQQLTE